MGHWLNLHRLIATVTTGMVLSLVSSVSVVAPEVTDGVEAATSEPATSRLAHYFVAAMGGNPNFPARQAIEVIDRNWNPLYLPFFIEDYQFSADAKSRRELKRLLTKHTSRAVAKDIARVKSYVWEQDLPNTTDNTFFNRLLYRQIDPSFNHYFAPEQRLDIPLDEVIWGGVGQDGIPPLRDPAMIPAGEAGYLMDAHVVFGIEIEGEFRAYPKRVLAWHEMFTEKMAGIPLAGGLLHPLRHRNYLRNRVGRRCASAGHQRLLVPVQQIDVRSRHSVPLEHVGRSPRHWSACRQGDSAESTKCRPHEVGRVEISSPHDARALSGDGA
ncbi:MAG: DUF3179 domain-containing protein [Candidatus Synoicihabitans palmerolidicus]|nr:DUF3179 domain-containing protein [Candidatus Synoicihabitans palmerolidicus]